MLVDDDSLAGDEPALGARSAGQVPQSPLKKPQGLPRRQVQEPAEFTQVRMRVQLGSAIGSLEAEPEPEEPEPEEPELYRHCT